MFLWLGILIAVLFAYSAIKLGFYQTWTMLFNILIAVYLAIHLRPMIQDFLPIDGQYCSTLALLIIALGVFAVLHGFSYILLLGQFEVTFPRQVNLIGAGILGFLAGFLVWSFASLVVCTTPFCNHQFIKDIGFSSKKYEEGKLQGYLLSWCSFVDKFVVSGDSEAGTEKAVKELLTKPTRRSKSKLTTGTADANNPPDPNCAHDMGTQKEPVREHHTIIPP